MFTISNINTLKDLLITKGETISVAESVTSGLVQAALASAENAMQIFQGGITVYNVGQKYRHLLVDPIHALACNCVSEKVAREMAQHVCQLFASDWGLGITGYASPVPESDNQLFAYYAISYHSKVVHSGKIKAGKSDPNQVKLYFVEKIIEEAILLAEASKK